MTRRGAASLAVGAIGLAVAVAEVAHGRADTNAGRAGEWRHYSADLASTKYSPLDRINAKNVHNLQVVWRHAAVDPQIRQSQPNLPPVLNNYRATPLMIGGTLYVQNAFGLAEALDAATGQVRWTQAPLAPGFAGLIGSPASRGLAYWDDQRSARVLTVRGSYLFALDAQTGAADPKFGEAGKVDLRSGLGPLATQFSWSGAPLVVNDTVVIGANGLDFPTRKEAAPGHVRAYDVRTGALKWTFHAIPQDNEFGVDTWEQNSWQYTGATNLWSTMSADPELGYVYLPLSSPTNDWYGGHRLGANLFADAIVCVDAATGKRVWHYQMVHHDLWDYDLPTAPILTDITVDGRKIKAVVQLTKQGFAFVFDRVTGKPVWPIEERPVPQSVVPGERTWATQPFPTRPPAFTRQGITTEDLIDFTPELREKARRIADDYVLGPIYTPPPLQGANGKKGQLQVPGWVGGADWNGGAFDPETNRLYVPTVYAPVISVVAAGDPKTTNFSYWNPLSARDRDIVGPEGLPLLKPPYGTIVALDLNKGDIAWTVPNGDGPRNHPLLKSLNLPPLGQPGRAGPLLTRSLLFVGEGDPIAAVNPPGGGGLKFRAYDKKSGAVVWETALDAGTTGTPMTYQVGNRQFIVVAIGSRTHSAELVALALP
ncbi:MAG TPA: pyrroloquinoline quinone-dependent dehydrogenase [Vicinamibacterales bacterium]